METIDLTIFESGSGGDLAVINGDLAVTQTLYNQVYLSLFGGNIEANTTTNVLPTEQRFDWWGNLLTMPNTPNEQFNSNTERTLNEVALNSVGRQTILRAVEADLSYLEALLNYSVGVELLNTNRVRISINFTQKTNQQNKTLILVYDNAKQELIIERIL